MKVSEYEGEILFKSGNKSKTVLISVTLEGKINDLEEDVFKEIETLNFPTKVGEVEIVLLHINAVKNDMPFLTTLIIDRLKWYGKQYAQHDLCICLNRSCRKEFRNTKHWNNRFRIPYKYIHLKEVKLTDVLAQ